MFVVGGCAVYSVAIADRFLRQNWKKVFQVYDDNDPRGSFLYLTFTLASQAGTANLVVLGADRDIWTSDGQIWHDTKAIKKCVCEIKVILCQGCQCGGS